MSLSLFGLFIFRLIASIVVTLYLFSFFKPIKKIKPLKREIGAKKANQQLRVSLLLRLSIGLLLILGPLIVSQKLFDDYKADKLSNESEVVNGKIIELQYFNGHMSSSGYVYEFYVDKSKYKGRTFTNKGLEGQSIKVVYFKDNPWINKKVK